MPGIAIKNPDGSRLSINEVNVKEIVKREGSRKGGFFNTYTGTPATGAILIDAQLSELGGHNYYIEKFVFQCSVDCSIRLDMTNQNGLLTNAGLVQYPIFLKANTAYELNYEELLRWMANIQIKWLDAAPGAPITIKGGWIGYRYSMSKKIRASKNILYIGDSITAGSTSTINENNPYLSWANLVYLRYFDTLGIDVKPVNKGIQSNRAEDLLNAINCGWIDIDNVSLIFIALGTNISASLATFQNSMTAIINHCKTVFPKKHIVVMAPITRLDANEATLVTYRAALQTIVSGYNNSLIHYLPTQLAFDATDVQFGVTAGDVHTNDTGHAAMATYINNYLAANNIVPI